jgi:hypothetical protein
MNPRAAWLGLFARLPLLLLAMLAMGSEGLAASSGDPGRLFYTPAQRTQLEAARAGNIRQSRQAVTGGTQTLRFDGRVTRSDGSSTSWINGQPRAGAAGVAGLKPGQIRAGGKIYEPYQVLRPGAGPAIAKEPAP